MNQEIISHMTQFWRKPTADKLRALRYHFKTGLWNHFCPQIPFPTRLPHGGWWLARNDLLSDAVFARICDGSDVKFLERFLREATTVVDIQRSARAFVDARDRAKQELIGNQAAI